MDFSASQVPESEARFSQNMAHASSSYQDELEFEHEEIYLRTGLVSQTTTDDTTPKHMQLSKPEGRKGDTVGLALVAGGAAVFVALTWLAVLGNNPKALGAFAFHPTLQSLSIALFAFGILTLQPTSNPTTKKAGLLRHQLIILGLAVPCICIGVIIIIGKKELHEAPHFTTWHGTFGIIAMAWMLGQVALGAASVWFGGAAFGGAVKAKGVWKYHRLSGYTLFLVFLVTAAIGGACSSWMIVSASQVSRIFGYVIAPTAMLIGLWSRARLSKMKLF